MQILIGFAASILISWLAFRLHSLDLSGAYAAALIGGVIFGIGGWQWAALLLTFFITSSALTTSFRKHKARLQENFSKGSRRDAGQVIGNGALPALFAALHGIFPAAGWPWLGFAASLAAINADTWATELGTLSPDSPRLITDLKKRVTAGTSGAVSLVGTLTALGGSALIGLFTVRLMPSAPSSSMIEYGALITLGGLLGSLFDSFLGATVQAMYFCPLDKKETERHPTHTCGTPTTRVRGWPWLNNDWVNFGCATIGAAFTLSFFLIRRG